MEEIIDPYLTSEDLALRWKMAVHTLEQWRWKGHGPEFVKFGKRVLYHQKEIAQFEEHVSQTMDFDVKDPCYACIQLTPNVFKGGEEAIMGP